MLVNILYIFPFVIKYSLGENFNQHVYSHKSLTDFIKDLGYPVEVHHVTTTDGYKITMHRIPKSPMSKQKAETLRPPLLLVHGLGVSGSMYIVPLPGIEKTLAYLLSDDEYDIWILHVRGTHLSMKHTTLTSNDEKFWDFSFHEIGLYDVTRSIDYIIENTKAKKIHYCGLSQGTTAFFVALSMKPEYNKKVSSAYLMVPVGSPKNMNGLAKYLIESQLAQVIANTFKALSIPYLPLKNYVLQQELYSFCQDKVQFLLCQEFTEFTVGPLNRDLNLYDLFLVSINHLIDNIGAKQVKHYMKVSKSKNFEQYDYGIVENQKRYKSKSPPAYNLSQITVPITLMSTKLDNLATEQDVLVLKSNLRNVRHVKEMGNHVDFLATPDLLKKIKDDMVQFFSLNYV